MYHFSIKQSLKWNDICSMSCTYVRARCAWVLHSPILIAVLQCILQLVIQQLIFESCYSCKIHYAVITLLIREAYLSLVGSQPQGIVNQLVTRSTRSISSLVGPSRAWPLLGWLWRIQNHCQVVICHFFRRWGVLIEFKQISLSGFSENKQAQGF